MHTREIAAYGGLANRMPIYAAVFMLFTMANVGLPGTSGFVGEFLTIIGGVSGQHLDGVIGDNRSCSLSLLCLDPVSKN
jgi:NADH:ubiquinone oxidoreductase subunit 4 (subunit M)